MRSDFGTEVVVASLNAGSAGPGAGVDLKDCNEVDAHIAAGAVGATYSIEESDDNAAFAAAADADVVRYAADGTVEHKNALVLAADEVGMLGYVGHKQYVRIATTAADGAGFFEKSRMRSAGGSLA
jgi:hypothetical protein